MAQVHVLFSVSGTNFAIGLHNKLFDSLQIKLQLLTLSRHYQLGTIISEPRALLCSVLNDRLAVLNHEDQKMLKHSTIANVVSFPMYSLPSYSFIPFIFYSCRAKKCISFFFYSPQKQPSRGGVLRKRNVITKICTKFAGEHPCRNAISTKLQSNFIENALRCGCSPAYFQNTYS